MTSQGDTPDLPALKAAVQAGPAELGPVDIILADAGIALQGGPEPNIEAVFRSVTEVNLIGVWNAVVAAVPAMIERERERGRAIVLTSTTQGLRGTGGDGSGASSGYAASKPGVVGLMRTSANWLAPHSIRVNSIHPTGVNTPVIVNNVMSSYLNDHPSVGDAMPRTHDRTRRRRQRHWLPRQRRRTLCHWGPLPCRRRLRCSLTA